MSGFSGALQLTDLDDFITPSQVKYLLCTTFCEMFSFFKLLFQRNVLNQWKLQRNQRQDQK